jgi:hypothetical protein
MSAFLTFRFFTNSTHTSSEPLPSKLSMICGRFASASRGRGGDGLLGEGDSPPLSDKKKREGLSSFNEARHKHKKRMRVVLFIYKARLLYPLSL